MLNFHFRPRQQIFDPSTRLFLRADAQLHSDFLQSRQVLF